MIQTENLGVLGFYPLTSLHRSPRSDADTVVTGSSSEFPYPSMSPPKPTFEFGFRVAVRLAPDVAETVVEGGKTVELARVVCGSWSGPLGSGAVLVSNPYTSTCVPSVFKGGQENCMIFVGWADW